VNRIEWIAAARSVDLRGAFRIDPKTRLRAPRSGKNSVGRQ
jgi:hypothetical protein